MVSLMEICQRIFELRASLNVGHHGPTFSFVFRTILLLEAETRLWQIWIFLKSFVFNYYFLTTQQQIDWDQDHSLNAGPKSGHWSLETLVTVSPDQNVTPWRWTLDIWVITMSPCDVGHLGDRFPTWFPRLKFVQIAENQKFRTDQQTVTKEC